jgi:NAD(P)-dependent dehydrogenase (short-subunit alcohol dehydrogenase family)
MTRATVQVCPPARLVRLESWVASSRLAGKVCVVNGAASEIGRAVAGRFMTEGAVVVGVDQAEHGVGQQAIQADLTDEPQVKAMYKQVVRGFGRLDVIYNNMGLMDRGDRSALE